MSARERRSTQLFKGHRPLISPLEILSRVTNDTSRAIQFPREVEALAYGEGLVNHELQRKVENRGHDYGWRSCGMTGLKLSGD